MHSKKQQILHLEARTRRRRNDLRRAFNQELLQKATRTAAAAEGKRGQERRGTRRPNAKNITPNLFNLPEAVQISILKQNSCEKTP